MTAPETPTPAPTPDPDPAPAKGVEEGRLDLAVLEQLWAMVPGRPGKA